MKRMYSAREVVGFALLVAVFSSFLSISAIHLLVPEVTIAQEVGGNMGKTILYAGPRRDTMKDESFIFYNPDTGDLWVYRNKDFKKHYQLTNLGENLEELK